MLSRRALLGSAAAAIAAPLLPAMPAGVGLMPHQANAISRYLDGMFVLDHDRTAAGKTVPKSFLDEFHAFAGPEVRLADGRLRLASRQAIARFLVLKRRDATAGQPKAEETC